MQRAQKAPKDPWLSKQYWLLISLNLVPILAILVATGAFDSTQTSPSPDEKHVARGLIFKEDADAPQLLFTEEATEQFARKVKHWNIAALRQGFEPESM